MNLYAMSISAVLSFVFLMVVFRPLEIAFPAQPKQRFLRPAWFTDLCFFLGQYLIWNGLVLWVLSQFSFSLEGIVPPSFRQRVAAQPWWLQVVEVVVLSDTFRGIWAIYIHSNVRLPTGPLRVLLGAPELHHWHHDSARDAGNYANISPLMDILFGTYHCPDHEPERLGISEPTPKTYIGYMIRPLLARNLNRRRNAKSAQQRHPLGERSTAHRESLPSVFRVERASKVLG